MNVYPSAFISQGPLKDKEVLSEDFTDLPRVTRIASADTHAHAGRSGIHTLSAHMLSLTLMADLLSVPL